ncbi:MAG: nucleotidyltransferase domain-containing protein [Candidatus Diapherotrites archaeon]|nr:nucleotidyltransferase domain-containing protein [Candidatus Diapherotrites archaeon]
MNIEEKILEHLKKEPSVIGALIFGSYARNPAGVHNDIDVIAGTESDWKKMESIILDGIHVEIFYNNINEIKKELSHPFELDRNRWFENTKIIFDTNNRIQELVDYAKSITKQKLENFNKNWWQYKIGDNLQDVEKETDNSQIAFLNQCLFRDILTAFFLSQKQIPPKDNYFVKKAKLLNKNLGKLIDEFTKTTNTDEQKKILEKMITFIEPQIGKPTIYLTTPKIKI